jgi:ATP-binding cassette subfamily C protein LapB
MFAEITRRLAAQPLLAVMAAALSILIAILGLVPSVYAAQVMGRFATHGQMGTLVTMSVGLVVAIMAELTLRWLRHRLLEGVCLAADDTLCVQVVSRAGEDELGRAVGALEMVASTYSAAKIAAFMDVAAVILYLATLWLLSAGIGVAATAVMIIAIGVELAMSRVAMVAGAGRDGARGAIFAAQPGGGVIPAMVAWMDRGSTVARVGNVRESAMGATNSLSYAFVLAVGAVMVVDGTLSPGTLFGIGLIASRAVGMALKATSMLAELQRGQPAMEAVIRFLREERVSDAREAMSRPARPLHSPGILGGQS